MVSLLQGAYTVLANAGVYAIFVAVFLTAMYFLLFSGDADTRVNMKAFSLERVLVVVGFFAVVGIVAIVVSTASAI